MPYSRHFVFLVFINQRIEATPAAHPASAWRPCPTSRQSKHEHVHTPYGSEVLAQAPVPPNPTIRSIVIASWRPPTATTRPRRRRN